MGASRRKPAELNARQALFVAQYAKDGNGTQAAIRAGYAEKSAHVTAAQLLAIPKIYAAAKAAHDEALMRAGVEASDVLTELKRIGLSDVGNLVDEKGKVLALKAMPESARRAISSIEVDEHGTTKVRLWPKGEALNTLARHLGLLVDKVEVTHKGKLEHYLAAAKAIRAQQKKQAGGAR